MSQASTGRWFATADREPVKNEDLAYATLDYIREHPREWAQEQYFCGTTACFAGRALLIHLNLRDERDYNSFRHAARMSHSRATDTATQARDALGWTNREAVSVFRLFTDEFEVLERQVKRVLNGEVK